MVPHRDRDLFDPDINATWAMTDAAGGCGNRSGMTATSPHTPGSTPNLFDAASLRQFTDRAMILAAIVLGAIVVGRRRALPVPRYRRVSAPTLVGNPAARGKKAVSALWLPRPWLIPAVAGSIVSERHCRSY